MIRFPIEEGQILQYARALGDENRLYVDRDHAASSPFGALLAPPTFSVVSSIFDPDFEGRPRPGHPWPPAGRGGPLGGDTFHSQQSFEYFRHPVAGETLLVTCSPARQWQRQGRRGGTLTFSEKVSDFSDGDGRSVIRSAFTTVQTGREVDPAASSQVIARTTEPGSVLVRSLTRTQIVLYAAASGDFHPLHHDEELCHSLGYPSIFPHGMYLMGLGARLLTDRFGDGSLQVYRARFLQPVWPGDTIIGRLTVEPPEASGDGPDPDLLGVRVGIELSTQEDSVLMQGEASVREP